MSELVVLLGADGAPSGTAEKHRVHTYDTALHLAFSCHLLDGQGRVLLTRRALDKQTWPGVWTNSVCGHPAPAETMTDAVARRARQELGMEVRELQPMLPDFRYRAVDASGIVENEVCPVFTAVARGPVRPDPREVMEWAWVEPAAVHRAVSATPFAFSPWFVRQVREAPFCTDSEWGWLEPLQQAAS